MRLKKYIKESKNLKNYIKSILTLFNKDTNGKQVAYWKWIEKQAKTVKCKSYKSDPTLKTLIEESLDLDPPKIKECYRNSWKVASHDPRNIEIIGGYTSALGVPLEHAWNFYKPKKIYFDLTAEICLNKKVETAEYLQIVKLKLSDVTKILTSNQFSVSGLVVTWYFTKIAK
jgi:hypothetical protein